MPKEKIYISDRNLERVIAKILKGKRNLKKVSVKRKYIILKFSKLRCCKNNFIVKQFSKKKYDCVQTAKSKNLGMLFQKGWKQKNIIETDKIWLVFFSKKT